jgi:hypothetical protein
MLASQDTLHLQRGRHDVNLVAALYLLVFLSISYPLLIIVRVTTDMIRPPELRRLGHASDLLHLFEKALGSQPREQFLNVSSLGPNNSPMT